MSGEQQLQGPDFAAGISESELVDGKPLLGHAGGEAVLLVRRQGEVFAIAAHCTHYGGPLAEGLVVGDTVRCPWHHACFSLRTGVPLRAPALKPVACYEIVRGEGRLRVGGARPAAAPAVHTGGPPSVVVVGAGAAGAACALELRRLGYGGPLTLLGSDPEPPYDRPNLSKDYLAGNAPEEWIPLHGPELYRELAITLAVGRTATALDPTARRLSLDDGSTLPYGALLLATGAEPRRLPLPGADLPHVHTLRSLADSRALIAAAAAARQAVIIGASFIGLEVAAALRARNVAVTVVAPAARPLEAVMGAQVGDFLRALHEEHGVAFRLGERPAAITADAVRLASGGALAADLVVMAVGVEPRLALAEGAGLRIDRGVVVNEYLETSAADVFAAGDIARWPDPHSAEAIRVEHWVVAERQGQAVAANMLGARHRFTAVPFFWSQHYDVSINYVGHAAAGATPTVHGSLAERSAAIVFREGAAIRAIATLFRDDLSLAAEFAFESGDLEALERLIAS
jgi:NADPH-dependent 2,4-dienoyl-CoA reductase/sulfur reductase-like enzyme/nitrite reductase/ring-hydroxylating ferredoxin subunit